MATTSDRAHALTFRLAQWLWLPIIEAIGQAAYRRGRLHATLMDRRVHERRSRRVISVTRRRV